MFVYVIEDTLELQILKHIKSALGLTPVSSVGKCLGCLLYTREMDISMTSSDSADYPHQHSPWISTWLQAEAQTRFLQAFGGNSGHGHQ